MCSASKRGLPSQFDQSSSRSVAKQKESLNLNIVVVVVPLKLTFGNLLQDFLSQASRVILYCHLGWQSATIGILMLPRPVLPRFSALVGRKFVR